MKIKLAILEKDIGYLNRIVSVFNQKYADKIQVYSFTTPEVTYKTLHDTKIDVLLASDFFDIDFSKIPSRCGFAYFVDYMDIETLNNQKTICKFQKADLIYKQILSLYSENAENITGLKITDEACKLIAFTSPCGGAGSSTVAAAAAMHFAAQGRKTLYLNLEKFGSSDTLFSGEGQFDFSDVIFSVKSKKSNLSMKMESCVKEDNNGVHFFSAPKQALDMLELHTEEMIRLISELELTGSYEYIVVDVDFSMDKEFLKFLKKFHSIIVTTTGTELSNNKLFRMYTALGVMEKNDDAPVLSRMAVLYNKFSNKTCKVLGDIELKSLGGIQRFDHATDRQVVEQISKMPVLDALV
ncbi:chromosome partitioning protein ParA [uncultured Ruminococcus sp.]|uniref:chromosome partitioning protein ParA n=1 Tax=uncultured Ruminococcus sp. TaxID=165186 RepID=UPI00292E16C0|nr:chromosome partitioning protein ParA [uncultured Ruminococcus sp.]